MKNRLHTLHALLLRELMMRYGHGNLGFLWLVVEPLILTVGVIGMWSIMYGSSKHGVNIIGFVLSGYSMLTLWRHVTTRSLRCLSNNAEVFYHRGIRHIDLIIVQHFLEIFGILIAFFVVYIPLTLLDYTEPIDDYLLFLGGWFLVSFFSTGVGLTLAVISELSEQTEKFIGPFMYVTLPLTGIFTMVEWLPKSFQEILLWSPLVHGIEMIRAGYFGPDVPTHFDILYLAGCGVFANALGILLFPIAEQHMESA